MTRESSDRASATRKRALRRLAREHYEPYREHYDAQRGAGYVNHQARNRAWTALRRQFPDKYLELYALEQAAPGADAPAAIRTKSWQRATALLCDLRAVPYRECFERFRGEGRGMAAAYYRASAEIRAAEPELFARLLAGEIRMWLRITGE